MSVIITITPHYLINCIHSGINIHDYACKQEYCITQTTQMANNESDDPGDRNARNDSNTQMIQITLMIKMTEITKMSQMTRMTQMIQ